MAVALSLLLVASVAACSGDSEGASPSTTTASTGAVADGVDVPATGVLLSDDPRAEQIVGIVEQALPELDLRSVIFGVWVGDEEIVRGAIDAPTMQPLTPIDAKVRVGQPMEAMLATVMLQLGSEGKLELDEPVQQYVPELVNADRITPRMLANGTGGTPDFVNDAEFNARLNADPFVGYTFDELLDYAQKNPPLFEPGTAWAYSHTEIAALVEVMGKATGQTLSELMATRIFDPLDMSDSAAYQDNSIEPPAYQAFTNSRGVYEDSTAWDPSWGLNGGMNASIADLGRWLRALNDGELLSEADATESLAPVNAGLGRLTDQHYFAYGSLVSGGWILGNPSLNGYQGFTAQHRDPSVTVVVWSTVANGNPGDSNASITISQRIADVVSDEPINVG